MKFDVVILDVTTYKPYDGQVLATQPLGGTEATVVRIAEALAAYGLKVAVVEHCYETAITYNGVFYLPYAYLSQIDCYNFISLRGTHGLDLFPKAKKFSWHQDVPTQKILSMKPAFIEHNVTVVGVSKWHKAQLSNWLNDPNGDLKDIISVKTAYNPVPNQLYGIERPAYNKNKMLWAASPHKGLREAIPVFRRLREILGPNLELHVFNPGYFGAELDQEPGVIQHGAVPCYQLWQEMLTSLCLFYPSTFEETFGCIAAEANALGCPVAGYRVAALNESAEAQRGLSPPNDYVDLIKKVEHWYNGYRPEIRGKEKFKTTEVVQKWLKWLQ